MKYAYAFAILLALLVVSSGCTQFYSQFNPAPTPAPTKAPTVKPTVRITANVTMNVTNTTAITTLPTPEPTQTEPVITIATPTPTPTGFYLVPPTLTYAPTPIVPGETVNPFTDTWMVYQNRDFKVDYPGNWQIVETTGNQPDPVLYGEGKFIGQARVVRFEAGDGKTNFTVSTSDLANAGQYKLDTTYEWCQRTVTPRLYDVSGFYGAVSNYEVRYTTLRTPYVTFSVQTPPLSAFYPYVYTERNLASWNHIYTMRFNNYGNLTDYKEMKARMFDSVRTQEKMLQNNGEFT